MCVCVCVFVCVCVCLQLDNIVGSSGTSCVLQCISAGHVVRVQ